MEKKWLLRLPRDLDDWLTLKAAEETVVRRKRVSKNTLIIELASSARGERLSDPDSVGPDERGGWRDVKSALAFILDKIQRKTETDSSANERLKKKISFNLKMLESYLEDLEE